MRTDVFSDASLVLIGHGSTLNADSARPVRQHAAQLRERRIFAEVREGFWKQEPYVSDVVRDAAGRRVFIVPLFISEGYFSEEVIPRELGFRQEGQAGFDRVRRRGAQMLHYCRPVGSHSSMTGVLLARARGVVKAFPFPREPAPQDITLLIAGHGTERNENSRSAIEHQAELLRAMNLYAGVHAVFMEEAPRIAACYALAKTRHIVMVPFFISDGLHSREDIPRMLGETERNVRERLASGQPTWRNPTERHGKLVWYSASIGSEPLLTEVILERVRESAADSSVARSAVRV